MEHAQRISVGKSDEAAAVVEKILEAAAPEVVVSVPKFSRLAESLANFHLLKREADAALKKLMVESVDDLVVDLARKSGIESMNPFFSRERRQFSDIVSTSAKAQPASLRRIPAPRRKEEPREAKHAPERVAAAPPVHRGGNRGEPQQRERRRFSLRRPVAFGILALCVAGGGWFLFGVPRAEVRVVATKIPWTYAKSVHADTAFTAPDSAQGAIPAQFFSEKKNLQLLFPATGKRNVERRAGGTITIWNAFSSASQALVANTRFETPDGKIFRLTRTVTVPGARVAGGAIEPSSLEAAVVADQPGPSSNIGPVERFTIPGFRGTPKFSGFYGSSKGSMSGGVSGEVAVPTDEDVRRAREAITEELTTAARISLMNNVPDDLKILEGASAFAMTDMKMNSDVDEEGKFSGFGEGELTAIAFREADLLAFLRAEAQREEGEHLVVKEGELVYGAVGRGADRERMSVAVEYRATLVRELKTEDIRRAILGRSEDDLKRYLLSLPGVDRTRVSLWPFWVRAVPKSEGRVAVTIE